VTTFMIHGFCTFLVVLMPRSRPCWWNLCTKTIDQNFRIELERFATFKQIWNDFCHLCAFRHIFVLVSDHIMVFSLHYFFGVSGETCLEISLTSFLATFTQRSNNLNSSPLIDPNRLQLRFDGFDITLIWT
jgi:hypothetical protein